MNMIEIDGATREGGGQILRSALSLSAITKMPFHIFNIRANRQKPGLQPQHLMAVQSMAKLCNGKLEGGHLHSHELIFVPGTINPGQFHFDIGTAGSAILVLQTILPPLLLSHAQSTITIVGGTHVPKSPSYDYFAHVFLPAIHRFGAELTSKLILSGYYPKGGGKIFVSVIPSSLKGCQNWTNPRSSKEGIIRLGKLPLTIGQREYEVFRKYGFEDVDLFEEETFSPGNSLTIWEDFRGACSLGIRGKTAENVAKDLLEEFRVENEDVDRHLADQLLLYASLAAGKTVYKTSLFTEHFKTHIYIISKFLKRTFVFNDNEVSIM